MEKSFEDWQIHSVIQEQFKIHTIFPDETIFGNWKAIVQERMPEKERVTGIVLPNGQSPSDDMTLGEIRTLWKRNV